MKLDLLTNAIVVDDAIKFVNDKASSGSEMIAEQNETNETTINKIF